MSNTTGCRIFPDRMYVDIKDVKEWEKCFLWFQMKLSFMQGPRQLHQNICLLLWTTEATCKGGRCWGRKLTVRDANEWQQLFSSYCHFQWSLIRKTGELCYCSCKQQCYSLHWLIEMDVGSLYHCSDLLDTEEFVTFMC